MGNPLVCNFLKELGLTYYVKVDVHVSDFVDDLSFGRKLNPKEQFILSWLLAQNLGIEPFFLTKYFMLGASIVKAG